MISLAQNLKLCYNGAVIGLIFPDFEKIVREKALFFLPLYIAQN